MIRKATVYSLYLVIGFSTFSCRYVFNCVTWLTGSAVVRMKTWQAQRLWASCSHTCASSSSSI